MFKLKTTTTFILAILFFAGCTPKVTEVADIDTSYYRVNKRQKSDDAITKMILPYKNQLDGKMDEVIAMNPKEMTKARPNSTLGNWFADVLLEEAQVLYDKPVDIALQNYGGIRVPTVAKGDVTVRHIYELMPFDNELVILELDADLLQTFLNRIAEKGGWPISKSLTFTKEGNLATNIVINGETFDRTKRYTVAVPDYIANGGDKCFFLKDVPRYDADIMIRDLVIDNLRSKYDANPVIEIDDSKRIKTSKDN